MKAQKNIPNDWNVKFSLLGTVIVMFSRTMTRMSDLIDFENETKSMADQKGQHYRDENSCGLFAAFLEMFCRFFFWTSLVALVELNFRKTTGRCSRACDMSRVARVPVDRPASSGQGFDVRLLSCAHKLISRVGARQRQELNSDLSLGLRII